MPDSNWGVNICGYGLKVTPLNRVFVGSVGSLGKQVWFKQLQKRQKNDPDVLFIEVNELHAAIPAHIYIGPSVCHDMDLATLKKERSALKKLFKSLRPQFIKSRLKVIDRLIKGK